MRDKKNIKHIKTYYDFLKEEIRKRDWDLMSYLEACANDNNILRGLINIIYIKAYDELTKEMNENGGFFCKEELINTFIHIIEKQRGYPLWMWEYSDIEDCAKAWADANWYIHLFLNDN